MNIRNAGRKKKNSFDKRTHRISFYLNDEEYIKYKEISKKIANNGDSYSIKDYLRAFILGKL